MTYSDFIEPLDVILVETISYLDKVFTEELSLTRRMRYRIPFYDDDKWICYLNPQKQNTLELCFLNGQQIKQSYPMIDLRGRKTVGGLIIDPFSDIPIDLISEIIDFATISTKSIS